MTTRSTIEHTIPGDYQLDALMAGWRLQRAWHRARLDLLQRVLPPPDDGLVLDAAAWSGVVTWHLRDRRIVSADMRVSACRALRAHTAGALAVAGLLPALPFRDATFSQAYLLEVIEHLDAEQGISALREIRRVSRRGAKCLVTTPNYRSHWPVIERLLDTLRLTPPMSDAQHVARYDRRRLADVLTSGGWKVLRLGTFNLVAPLVGAVSAAAGSRAVGFEASYLRHGGALLFAVCERRDD